MRLLLNKIFNQQRSRYLENLKIPAFHLLADHSLNVAIKIVNQCVLAYKIISVDRLTADQSACSIPNAPQTLHVSMKGVRILALDHVVSMLYVM